MNHYVLNGVNEVENWVSMLPNMTEEEAIATAPREVLEFAGILQADGDVPVNGLLFGTLALAGKSIVRGAINLGKKAAPTIVKAVKKVAPNLASKAQNFLTNRGAAATATKSSTPPRPDNLPQVGAPKIMPVRVSTGQKIPAPKVSDGAGEKPWYTNPLVIAGAGFLAYQLIKRK